MKSPRLALIAVMVLAVICLILPGIPVIADTHSAVSTVTGTLSPTGTTTAVTSSNNPSVFGQPVSFTATVSPIIGTGTPSGKVQFTVDGSNFGSLVTLSGGKANSIATTSLAVGNHVVTAAYGGDGSYLTSTGTLSGGQTVNKGQNKTNTYFISVPCSSDPGQPVTFVAAVISVGFIGIPTGTVTFYDGTTTVLGSGKLVLGLASFTTSSLSVGSHTITAVYGGDNSFLSSTSKPAVLMVLYDTKTTLTSTPNSSTFGQNVTFTAHG